MILSLMRGDLLETTVILNIEIWRNRLLGKRLMTLNFAKIWRIWQVYMINALFSFNFHTKKESREKNRHFEERKESCTMIKRVEEQIRCNRFICQFTNYYIFIFHFISLR